MPVIKKIVADPNAIEDFIIAQGVKAIPKKSKEIVIDFDATDDPLHGHQEGAYFHGYYRHYCYLPLYAFCGNIPLWAELRECKIDGCKGTVEALQKLIPVIRKRFGKKVRIICAETEALPVKRLWHTVKTRLKSTTALATA